MDTIEVHYNGYLITTDKTKMQPDAIHHWLSTEGYWCVNIPFNTVKTSIEHSFCIGVLHHDVQVGFARLITDYSTFAYLADVYVEAPHRGLGLSKKMMEVLMNLPWVKTLRRLSLATRDAHSLYEQFGFTALSQPDRMMERKRPDLY